MQNLKIRQLDEALLKVLNDSDVPVEAKRLILRNMLYRIDVLANEAICEEIKEQENNAKSSC